MTLSGPYGGAKALDPVCGEGFYTRKLTRAGAAEVLGVGDSAEMIRLTEAEERARTSGHRIYTGTRRRWS